MENSSVIMISATLAVLCWTGFQKQPVEAAAYQFSEMCLFFSFHFAGVSHLKNAENGAGASYVKQVGACV